MQDIVGRIHVDFDFLYVVRLRAPMLAASAEILLNALNDHNDTGGIRGQIIEIELPELKISGRALNSSEVVETMGFWNQPDGQDQARCHIPHHGIATYREGAFDWFASICFICSNVYIAGPSAARRHRIMASQHGWANQDRVFLKFLETLHPKVS